jgi:hypothetical protein
MRLPPTPHNATCLRRRPAWGHPHQGCDRGQAGSSPARARAARRPCSQGRRGAGARRRQRTAIPTPPPPCRTTAAALRLPSLSSLGRGPRAPGWEPPARPSPHPPSANATRACTLVASGAGRPRGARAARGSNAAPARAAVLAGPAPGPHRLCPHNAAEGGSTPCACRQEHCPPSQRLPGAAQHLPQGNRTHPRPRRARGRSARAARRAAARAAAAATRARPTAGAARRPVLASAAPRSLRRLRCAPAGGARPAPRAAAGRRPIRHPNHIPTGARAPGRAAPRLAQPRAGRPAPGPAARAHRVWTQAVVAPARPHTCQPNHGLSMTCREARRRRHVPPRRAMVPHSDSDPPCPPERRSMDRPAAPKHPRPPPGRACSARSPTREAPSGCAARRARRAPSLGPRAGRPGRGAAAYSSPPWRLPRMLPAPRLGCSAGPAPPARIENPPARRLPRCLCGAGWSARRGAGGRPLPPAPPLCPLPACQ